MAIRLKQVYLVTIPDPETQHRLSSRILSLEG
jgi:hypothetical protein